MFEELIEILTDPPHLIAEFITEGISIAGSILYVKFKLRKRDQDHQHRTQYGDRR